MDDPRKEILQVHMQHCSKKHKLKIPVIKVACQESMLLNFSHVVLSMQICYLNVVKFLLSISKNFWYVYHKFLICI